MRKVYREYTNGEITVEWRSELCNHSGICINGLPAVFNVLQIPWIDMKGASTEEIIGIVDECPTGAIAWRHNDKKMNRPVEPQGDAEVFLVKKGPIVVKGKLKIKMEDGEMIEKSGTLSLCRCGKSHNMPYCDGAHAHD